jgi:hypothetical protein
MNGYMIQMALECLLANLDSSNYDANTKHQLKCRVNRMIVGVSDNNPDGPKLDKVIISLGLNLLANSDADEDIKKMALQMLGEYLP